jgi:hypothetical protein
MLWWNQWCYSPLAEYVGTLSVGFLALCRESAGFPLHEKRLRVRLRLLPCITDLTHIAMADDSFLMRSVFFTFLMHEQNLSGIGNRCPSRTISSTLLEEWILTVLHM